MKVLLLVGEAPIVNSMASGSSDRGDEELPLRREFPTKEAARRALAGAAGAAANRFFRDATSWSTNFSVVEAHGPVYRLSFYTAARTPGFGKRYHQVSDQSGQVLQEYKETWGPDGLLEAKWVHGNPSDD